MQILSSQSALRMKTYKAALLLGRGSKSSQTVLCHGARLHPGPGHLPSPITLCSLLLGFHEKRVHVASDPDSPPSASGCE